MCGPKFCSMATSQKLGNKEEMERFVAEVQEKMEARAFATP